jgi:hypothetical protein
MFNYEISKRFDGKYNVWALFAPPDIDNETAYVLGKWGALQKKWQLIDVIDHPSVDKERWDHYDPFQIYRLDLELV